MLILKHDANPKISIMRVRYIIMYIVNDKYRVLGFDGYHMCLPCY